MPTLVVGMSPRMLYRFSAIHAHDKRGHGTRLNDGEIQVDAGVTDLRLCGPDHATPDPTLVSGVAKWICDSKCVILGVGLTRKFRRSDGSDYFHWLQVNNIHLHEEPAWQLS